MSLSALHDHCTDAKELLEELGHGSKVKADLSIAYGVVDRALKKEIRSLGVRHGPKILRPVLNTEDL